MRFTAAGKSSNEFLANFPLPQPIGGCFQAFARDAGALMPAALNLVDYIPNCDKLKPVAIVRFWK